MLTDELKDWLAVNAGIGDCYSPGAINYTDPDGISRQGSTGDVLNAFTVANLVGPDSVVIIANTNYTQLKTINENNDITITDVAFAYNNDGSPAGEPKYCTGTTCVPYWQCETPLNGYESDGCENRRLNISCNPVCIPNWVCESPRNGYESDGCGNRRLNTACNPTGDDTDYAGVHDFIGPPEGQPTVTLDLSNLEMKQDIIDYHFEMNNIVLTSTSDQPFYVALEVKLFAGSLLSCPTTGEVFAGMDRVSTSREARIILLDPGEVDNINADFYQPEAMRGAHTVCLLVHGAWTREELENEIAGITG